MGMNIISLCHKCKVRLFHLRGKERLIKFCHDHYDCGREDKNNIEVFSDYFDEKCEDYEDVMDKYYPS